MAILFVGIDLAKNVFAIHGVDEHGKAVLVRPSVPRARLHQLVGGAAAVHHRHGGVLGSAPLGEAVCHSTATPYG